jgi:drug/metabolite transporter (DMT)-like permease
MTTPAQTSAIEQIERVRNRIAIFIVGSFVGALMVFTFWTIPEGNRDIVTYMVGQLSGMALTALGFYFVNKIGQDAADAKRADNTGKALDAIKTVAQGAAGSGDAAGAAADEVVGATVEAAEDIKGAKT